MHLLRTKASFTGIRAELSMVVRSGTDYQNVKCMSLDFLNRRILLPIMPDFVSTSPAVDKGELQRR